MTSTRSTLAALLVLALAVPIAAWQGARGQVPTTPLPGRGQAPPARTTPLFECGSDQILPQPVPLSWATIALAADSRLYVPCGDGRHTDEHREARDARVLEDAWRSTLPEFRAQAVAAYGRLGRPEYVGMFGGMFGFVTPRPGAAPIAPTTWVPGVLALALDDAASNVRREAANAIGNALSFTAVEPDETGEHKPTPDQITYAHDCLETRLRIEKDDSVAAMIFETLGRLKYEDEGARAEVEALLVTQAFGPPVRVLGAARGLEALIRATARRPIQPQTRDKLRELAVMGPTGMPVPTVAGEGSAEGTGEEALLARVRRLAMLALQTARDDDVFTLIKASHDADWQVRRLAALRIDPSRQEQGAAYQVLKADRAFQVRYEVAGAEARVATRDHECGALLARVDDPEPAVAMHAIDLLPPGCTNAGAVVTRLQGLAGELITLASRTPWYLPTHAALALARLSPASVVPMLDAMTRRAEWHVRAAAATIAGVVRNNRPALLLSNDTTANVRTAALDALALMKSPDVTKAATRALMESSDHQLLRAAANALKGTPPQLRDDVNLALLAALDRLTRVGADNSRDARVAILQRLQELLPSEWTSRLNPFAADFDPRVRAAAITAYESVLQTTNAPPGQPVHRYPLQPTAEQLAALPTHARIKMFPVGAIEMDLLINDAPNTVARFVELVKAGYYNGLTFHRVVPNFVIQGGSPGANEYVGAPRFWRDEAGTVPHTRGAVGLSTRGHDTGDGQIFIDLVDLPRLDHDYTVFARITTGLDVVDHILEGARIDLVTTTVR